MRTPRRKVHSCIQNAMPSLTYTNYCITCQVFVPMGSQTKAFWIILHCWLWYISTKKKYLNGSGRFIPLSYQQIHSTALAIRFSALKHWMANNSTTRDTAILLNSSTRISVGMSSTCSRNLSDRLKQVTKGVLHVQTLDEKWKWFARGCLRHLFKVRCADV